MPPRVLLACGRAYHHGGVCPRAARGPWRGRQSCAARHRMPLPRRAAPVVIVSLGEDTNLAAPHSLRPMEERVDRTAGETDEGRHGPAMLVRPIIRRLHGATLCRPTER